MLQTLLELDKQALLWINSHHNLFLDAVLAPIALAGEVATIWIVVCIVLFILNKPGCRKMAIILFFSIIIVDRLFAAQLGHLFSRERPYLALEGIRQLGISWESNSFPSGHAHSVWLAAIILSSRWTKLRIPLIVFALLTCYSRPYFGMHYPGDVIAGSFMGIIAGVIIVLVEKYLKRQPKVAGDES